MLGHFCCAGGGDLEGLFSSFRLSFGATTEKGLQLFWLVIYLNKNNRPKCLMILRAEPENVCSNQKYYFTLFTCPLRIMSFIIITV